MGNLISTFGARIIGTWVAAGASWLLVHKGIAVDDTIQQQVTEHIVGLVLPTFMTVYALVHRGTSKKLNPGDAASSHLAEKEASEAEVLKR